MKLLLYCTKAKPYLYKDRGIEYALSNKKLVDNAFTRFNSVNGKVVAECDFKVEEIIFEGYGFGLGYKGTKTTLPNKLANDSCLYTYKDIDNYLQGKNGYAIHIKNLHIFDKPKELSDYYDNKITYEWVQNGVKYYKKSLSKAPQNMTYCYNADRNDYVLISIQPQWLCKILNGEKTIEIRKKILNCMKELII